MTREEFLAHYKLDKSHDKWQPIDSWNAVEIFRIMHDRLPEVTDESSVYAFDFYKKALKDTVWFFSLENHGSLFLTSKRMMYQHIDEMIENEEKP